MKELATNALEQEYPSIELAYPIAVDSYDTAAKRFDMIDGKLQTLLAFIVTVSVSVPSIAGTRGVSFTSYWFYAALVFFILSIALGMYARLAGKLEVLAPSELFEGWLGDPPWEFKKDMIYHAGQDFDANLKAIKFRWHCSVAITVLFVFESACLTAWVLRVQF